MGGIGGDGFEAMGVSDEKCLEKENRLPGRHEERSAGFDNAEFSDWKAGTFWRVLVSWL